ncbi:MAG: UTP--glucose-1-phosphate uridylyltransferase [Candidatus Uhrbacteria bacterium]
MSIKTAVIPVAGYGTRFLPTTKAMPKEMMPVVGKPVIQYVVEECVASGIENIVLVTGMSKRAVEDHFDYNYELQTWLKKQGKTELRREIKNIADMANFIYIRQKGPYGNGTPVLNARHIIGDNPFIVVWGDEFITSKKPRVKQLIEVYEKYSDPVLTAIPTDKKGLSRFGIIDPAAEVEPGVIQVKGIVEKPGPEKAPSKLAAIGGYLLTPDIFEILAKTKRGKDNEVWLVDAIFALAKKRAIYAKRIEGIYRDIGTVEAWLQTNVDMALTDKKFGKNFKKHLKKICKDL